MRILLCVPPCQSRVVRFLKLDLNLPPSRFSSSSPSSEYKALLPRKRFLQHKAFTTPTSMAPTSKPLLLYTVQSSLSSTGF